MNKSIIPINNAIKVLTEYVIDGEIIVEVSCLDYENYKSLPDSAEHYTGKRLVKTGWNSDKCYACFKQEKLGQLLNFYA